MPILPAESRVPYKYQWVYDQIKPALAMEWRKGNRKLPTEKELVQRYQVSIGTIRQAIGRLEDEGILRRVQGSGCYINGSMLAENRAIEVYFFGFGVADNSPHFRTFLAMTHPPGLREGFRFSVRSVPRVWDVLTPDGDGLFDAELHRIASTPGVDCILAIPGEFNESMVDRLLSLGKQVVFLDDFATAQLNARDLNQIRSDNTRIAVACVQRLRRAGHTRIGLVSRPLDRHYNEVFLDAMRRADPDARIDYIPLARGSFHRHVGLSESELDALIRRLHENTAIVTYGIDACMLNETLRARGVSIPGRLSLLSAVEGIPDMDCVGQDYDEYFATVFDLIERLMRPGGRTEKHILRPPIHFIDRNTIAPPV